MGEDAGVNLSMVHADGGAVRNALLMQFVADMNQLKVRAAQTPELSALGAVFSGCLGQKIYTSLEDLQNLPSGYVEYRSSMPPARADSLFAGWQAAVQQVLYQPKQG
jgi:glycerol kinase